MKLLLTIIILGCAPVTWAEYSFQYVTIDDDFPDTIVVSDILKVEKGYTYFYVHNTRHEKAQQVKVDCATLLYQSRYNMKESWDSIGEYVTTSDTLMGTAIKHICSK